MKSIKQQILDIMTIYYSNRDKALEWYSTPNIYFKHGFQDKSSPKEMVESGKGQEVIEWLKLILY